MSEPTHTAHPLTHKLEKSFSFFLPPFSFSLLRVFFHLQPTGWPAFHTQTHPPAFGPHTLNPWPHNARADLNGRKKYPLCLILGGILFIIFYQQQVFHSIFHLNLHVVCLFHIHFSRWACYLFSTLRGILYSIFTH